MKHITDVVFEKHYEGYRTYIELSDIPKRFLAAPEKFRLHYESDHELEHGDSRQDAYTYISILHEREMTHDEISSSENFLEKLRHKGKVERKAQYDKLKLEFEDIG